MESSLHPILGSVEGARTDLKLRSLIDMGLMLASDRSLDAILQAAVEIGRSLADASIAAFLYAAHDGKLEPSFHKISSKISNKIPNKDPKLVGGLPQPSDLLPPGAQLETTLRIDDLMAEPRYRASRQPSGSSPAAPGLHSYLAVPLHNRENELLGALLFGGTAVAAFGPELDGLLTAVAAQIALLIDNNRLTETLDREKIVAESARAEHRATSRRLGQALEATGLGTWTWDAATGMLDFDERAAAIFAVEPFVPISRSALRERIVHEDDRDLTPADLHEVLLTGGQYAAEYRIRVLDGVQRWIASRGNVTVSEGSGKVLGMIGTLQDITERKAQEAALRTSEKLAATGRLAATIAHEINNPLEAVTNLIYLAKTDPITPPSVSRMLETADGELARVSQIAQQTLGFYRDTTRPVTVDLNDLVKAVVDLFGRKLTNKRLQCTLDLQPGLSVVGLQGEIRQIVSNLLVNAIDATDTAGGDIRIRARLRHRGDDRGVSVLISDRGAGIPHHVRHRLFTPFTTTKPSIGTGLGLWVTRGMVEKHGGSVRFRTKTVHPSGTVFRVYLPESGSPQLFGSSSPILQ